MLIESYRETVQISWGGRKVLAQLRRTSRQVLRVEVKPAGDVIVFAPHGKELGEVEIRLLRKSSWIFRELDRIKGLPLPTPERRFVSGETHLLLGRQYRLSIQVGGDPRVQAEGSRLVVYARRAGDPAHCRRLVTAFYSMAARDTFAERLDAVFPPFRRRGMKPPSLMVRQMTKRWGSYTTNGRIVLNVELVRASPMLIDYVICHELAHAIHPDHGKGWQDLLNSVMPDWRVRKARLEQFLR